MQLDRNRESERRKSEWVVLGKEINRGRGFEPSKVRSICGKIAH